VNSFAPYNDENHIAGESGRTRIRSAIRLRIYLSAGGRAYPIVHAERDDRERRK
jgi:hypothetical protein